MPHPSVPRMYADCCRELGLSVATDPPASISSFHFCDDRSDADACAALVLQGIKRATASSVAELKWAGEPLPKPGDLHVVTNWDGLAVCVIRTVRVTMSRFCDVTAEFAATEGEGDGSLEYWRNTHEAYYRRVLKDTPYDFSEELPLCLEEFDVIWKPSQPGPADWFG